jgi:hypothetical protein
LYATAPQTPIATQLQAANSVTSLAAASGAREGREPAHIGDILVSSYVSAKVAMIARASPGSRRWDDGPELASASDRGAGAAGAKTAFGPRGFAVFSSWTVANDGSRGWRVFAVSAEDGSAEDGSRAGGS